MNRPWLRAGLIGAGILIVLNLLGLIPLVGCIAPFLQLIALRSNRRARPRRLSARGVRRARARDRARWPA